MRSFIFANIYLHFFHGRGDDFRAYDLAIPPLTADKLSPTGTEVCEATVFPFGRECGEELDFIPLTLQEHFCNCGTSAEVSVYLEWRVVVKEIGKRAF